MANEKHPAPLPAIALSSEKLRRLPPSANGDFVLFCSTHDEAALTRLIIAIVTDHSSTKACNVKVWNDDVRLIEDIGFDSLAVAETVFFFEDLFRISISNDEIMQLRTIGEMRAFILQKATAAMT